MQVMVVLRGGLPVSSQSNSQFTPNAQPQAQLLETLNYTLNARSSGRKAEQPAGSTCLTWAIMKDVACASIYRVWAYL